MTSFSLPSPETPFGERVARRLRDEVVVWFSSVAADGTPQPNPVWFLWDGATFLVYSLPDAARLSHIARNPHVSLNFDSNGSGGDIVVFACEARVAPDEPPADQNAAYLAKYRTRIDRGFGGPSAFAARYSAPLRLTPLKVRGL
ncbi:MAG TPA: TIGR03667 family PPOX class F420-dependent oxidoreductase [Ktedonobacterales bacterium]|nr:TIGR03667 family PPOX class F420-dependent oxidoreductase [Ktedonobacterales bacterium]